MASRNPPSLAITLHDHDAPYLAIPHEFITKYMSGKIPKDVVIRSANGGFVWNVKMKKIRESVCFEEGWSKVVKDAHFGYEDNLVLWLVGESTFKMWIHSPNGCEKILLPQTKHVKPEEKEKEEEEEDDDDNDDTVGIDDNGYPFFKFTLTSINNRKLRISKKFVELARIHAKKTLTLETTDGGEREVFFGFLYTNDVYKWVYVVTFTMGFVQCNISEGDEYVFTYITSEDKVLLAKLKK